MRGLEVERVAEILVETAADDRRRGSGYLVAPGRVLTAAHVVASAVSVRVRFEADRPGERVLEAEVRFEHPPTDVAVLAVPLDEVPVARFGRVGERDAVLRCSAMGFPAFKMRRGDDGRPYRDAEHVHGTCAVLSNRREGTLDLSVPPPDGSWDGMSGAAVFSGGRIVGVVAAHHLADGAGRLAVSRADRWAERLPGDELSALEKELSAVLAHLPDVLPPSRLGQIEAGYQALLRDIAPPELMGRAEELRELVDFCAGPETYRWIQGRPWTGKTALVSWFALHPPRGVVPVSFFITSRLAGQADSTAYTEAVVHQLAAIVGREPSPHASPGVGEAERRQLLAEAAERVAEDGGTLLLVVDGLDEDQSARDGATGPSIASLLPERPPPGVRVLATSRPNPGLPLDVKARHPLRADVVRQLGATDYATDLEHDARFELSRSLAGGDLEKELVGLLTAARGALRPEDLRELTGRELYALRHRVDGVFGRILRLRGESAGVPDERGYLFAHETLFVAAAEMLGPDVGPYLERIHDWADDYRRGGWPEGTPPYLLQQYGRMVTDLGDIARAVGLAVDPRRQDRMRAVTGSDAAALAEIDAVRSAAMRDRFDDLGRLAALVAGEELLARRNRHLPLTLPAVLARFGKAKRAEGLARSVVAPLDRARALVAVARVLAEDRDPHAADLAEEAQRLAPECSAGFLEGWEGRDAFHEVAGSAAVVMARLGRTAPALGIAERHEHEARDAAHIELPDGEVADTPVSPRAMEVLIAVSRALRHHDAERADEALARALRGIEAMEERGVPVAWFGSFVPLLGAVADAYAAFDPVRAAEVYDRIEALSLWCRTDTVSDRINVYEEAALMLSEARPKTAARLASRAAAWCMGELARGEGGTLSFEVPRVIKALVRTGLVFRAQKLADAYHYASYFGSDEISGWLRTEPTYPNGSPWAGGSVSQTGKLSPAAVAALACVLASKGAMERAERHAAKVETAESAAETFGFLAEQALRHDPVRVPRLVEAALRASRCDVTGDLWADHRLVALSAALAAIGECGQAEQLGWMISDNASRVMALATTATHLQPFDPRGARRMAAAANEQAKRLESAWGLEPAHYACLVAEEAGVRTRLYEPREVIRRHGVSLKEADASSVFLVAALWEHSPEETGDLIDKLEREARAYGNPDQRVLLHATLISAFGPTHPDRLRRLMESMWHESFWADWSFSPEAAVAAALLTVTTDPERTRQLIAHADSRYAAEVNEWSFRPEEYGACVLAHAALGEYEEAEALLAAVEEAPSVDKGLRPRASSRLRTAMAATIAGVPWMPEREHDLGHRFLEAEQEHRLHLIHRFIDIVMPRPSADAERLALARDQLRRVLRTDDWYLALPVLAHLDPDAVRCVRDVVFAHLGLEVSDAPPPPAPA
ncbi:trypsin-like peptidase domain-containing protein [Streptomyces sp. BRA346]|uniref:trypsin-like peptidase domain-containing protein n=1 Tax=Streptomyces sp. BRA346 TaxID=2878199 RepID=UPI0040640890